MSSVMRWRSGLFDCVDIGNSCLIEVETSIFRNLPDALLEGIHRRLPFKTQADRPNKLSRSDLVHWGTPDFQAIAATGWNRRLCPTRELAVDYS
jgi:hypothetical protein